MRSLPLVMTILVITAVPVLGASSFLGGFSGNIITPDAVVAPAGSWEVSYHQFTDFLIDADLKSIGVTYGLLPSLEVGAAFLDNDESDTALNAKYRIVPETATRPAILVGAFDLAGTADFLNDDPSFYIVFSKNVTPVATEVAGEPSKPLRFSIGFGSGIYDGIFAGLDWTLQPQLSVMAEFNSGDIGDNDNFFNAGLRYAATDVLRLDLATIDFEDIAWGVNYRITL